MIPDVKPGAQITASHINKIKRAATRKHTGEGIFETADFVVHRPVGGAGGAVAYRILAFVEEKADYLVCKDESTSDPTADPPIEAEVVFVAKIWELRKSSLHNQTIDGWLYEYQDDFTRKVTKAETTEIHAITPRYYPDQEIVATRIDLGVTTEPVEDDPLTEDIDESQPGQSVHYAFLEDNRVWLEVAE